MEEIKGVNLSDLVKETSEELVVKKRKEAANIIKQQLQRIEQLSIDINNLEKQLRVKKEKLEKAQGKDEAEKKLSTFDNEEDSDIVDIQDLEHRYSGFEYWSPEHDIFFTPLSYTEKDEMRGSLPEKWKNGYCSKHHSYIVRISGIKKVYCPKCLIEDGEDITKVKGLGRNPKNWTSFDRFEIIDLE